MTLRSLSDVVLVHAFCEDCEEEWDQNKAKDLAKAHAQKFGHTVRLEKTKVTKYFVPV